MIQGFRSALLVAVVMSVLVVPSFAEGSEGEVPGSEAREMYTGWDSPRSYDVEAASAESDASGSATPYGVPEEV